MPHPPFHTEPAPARPPVRVGTAPDGTLTYLVDLPPEALPPVLRRDLAAAWEAARMAALGAAQGAARSVARLFRFRRDDGSSLTLRLADRDALCWAGAVERVAGMGTSYGLSLCLRLLALVDLLAHARWASGLFSLHHGQAELSAALLGAAATAPLTAEARFDEQRLRATLAPAGTPA